MHSKTQDQKKWRPKVLFIRTNWGMRSTTAVTETNYIYSAITQFTSEMPEGFTQCLPRNFYNNPKTIFILWKKWIPTGDDVLDEVWNEYNSKKVPDQRLNYKNVAKMQKRELNMMIINISSQERLQRCWKKTLHKTKGNIMWVWHCLMLNIKNGFLNENIT